MIEMLKTIMGSSCCQKQQDKQIEPYSNEIKQHKNIKRASFKFKSSINTNLDSKFDSQMKLANWIKPNDVIINKQNVKKRMQSNVIRNKKRFNLEISAIPAEDSKEE